jgi:hypothetical protein
MPFAILGYGHEKLQRITNSLRFAASRRLGFHKTPVGLRPLWCFVPAHFARPGLASQALIRAGKTSYTAGTLCAIPPKIGWKIIE